MPPARGRKRKSTASITSSHENNDHARSISTTKANSTKLRSPVSTPPMIRAERTVHITQRQKQALIENLQLEISDRARKMRAQYALQAQSLKTRLEIRVHRIPAALRNTTIGDLLSKYSEQVNLKSDSTRHHDVARKVLNSNEDEISRLKRKSGDMDDDKENARAGQAQQKKRPRLVNAQSTTSAVPRSRAELRRVQAPQILSPKSNNSRPLPPSPVKLTSPLKSNLGHFASPLKPSLATSTAISRPKANEKSVRSKATGRRAASKPEKPVTAEAPRETRQRRAGPMDLAEKATIGRAGRQSNGSDATSSSAGTTIVRSKKGSANTSVTSAVTRGKVAGVAAKFEGIAGNGKKIAAAKTVSAKSSGAGTVKGGRSLRKRA